jgi:RNA polymerase sigma-70 factor, ECF subfamily
MIQPQEMIREQIIELLPRLRRYARTLARNVHDADDLVQIAVERALQRLDQFRSGTSLAAWLFGIVRHAWIDEARSRGRRQRLAAEQMADPEAQIQRDGQIGLLAVQAALERLPEEQRSAVILVLVEGFGYREAAEALDIPIGTLTSRLARARQALAELLGENTDATD